MLGKMRATSNPARLARVRHRDLAQHDEEEVEWVSAKLVRSFRKQLIYILRLVEFRGVRSVDR